MGVPGYAGMVMDKQSETPMLKGDHYVPGTGMVSTVKA
jgi:hypothetical protein